MPSDEPAAEDVYRSRFNRRLAIGIWVVCTALSVSFFFTSRIEQVLLVIPAAFVAALTWALLWKPAVRVDDEAVTLVNVLHAVRVPWNALIHVDTRFALTLYTPGRTHSAWAAPAPGRTSGYKNSFAGRDELRRAPRSSDDAVRPSDLVTSESGEAAFLVRSRWERLRKAGRIEAGLADETPVTISIDWVAVGALVALAAASIPAILLA